MNNLLGVVFTAPAGKNLPYGRASIASGYTPATVPGRCPEPGPCGGKGGAMQRVKKSEIITLRVTPRIKRIIQEQAKAAGLTVTDYLCYSGL